MQKFRVRVTQAIINKSRKLVSNDSRVDVCPVALAASRALGEPVRWGSTQGTAMQTGRMVRPIRKERVASWIANFDRNSGYSLLTSHKKTPVKPFSFIATVE